MKKWIKSEIDFLEGKTEGDYWDRQIEPYDSLDFKRTEL